MQRRQKSLQKIRSSLIQELEALQKSHSVAKNASQIREVRQLIEELEYAIYEIELEIENFTSEENTPSPPLAEEIVYSKFILQRQRCQALYYVEPLGKNLNIDMVQIPTGTFLMGASEAEPESTDNEEPRHKVSIPVFFMGKAPITQTQWQFIAELPQIEIPLNPDPARFKGRDHPVEQVSWVDAGEFCRRLARHSGRPYRLPSEAEWEYACRAGTTTPFHFGETLTTELANYKGDDERFGAYGLGPIGRSRQRTSVVTRFAGANSFGLYAMHGNVLEWCQDVWHDNYDGAPMDGSAWLTDGNPSQRVLRGGSWKDFPSACRSAYRHVSYVGDRSPFNGLRLACSLPSPPLLM